jgi:hypothetical protein
VRRRADSHGVPVGVMAPLHEQRPHPRRNARSRRTARNSAAASAPPVPMTYLPPPNETRTTLDAGTLDVGARPGTRVQVLVVTTRQSEPYDVTAVRPVVPAAPRAACALCAPWARRDPCDPCGPASPFASWGTLRILRSGQPRCALRRLRTRKPGSPLRTLGSFDAGAAWRPWGALRPIKPFR